MIDTAVLQYCSAVESELLARAVTKLETVNIYNTRLTTSQTMAIFTAICQDTKLVTLHISGNNLSSMDPELSVLTSYVLILLVFTLSVLSLSVFTFSAHPVKFYFVCVPPVSVYFVCVHSFCVHFDCTHSFKVYFVCAHLVSVYFFNANSLSVHIVSPHPVLWAKLVI
jgi:hypothetical protein